MPDTVAPMITDAVTQTNVKVLAEAPAMALGSLYQTIGNSVAMAAANAVYAQQQANVTYQAATTLGVTKLLGGAGSTVADHTAAAENLSEQHLQNLIDGLQKQVAELQSLQKNKTKTSKQSKGAGRGKK